MYLIKHDVNDPHCIDYTVDLGPDDQFGVWLTVGTVSLRISRKNQLVTVQAFHLGDECAEPSAYLELEGDED